MPAEIRSIRGAASQKIELKSVSITATNASVPQTRWVRNWSMRSSGSRPAGCDWLVTPASTRSIVR